MTIRERMTLTLAASSYRYPGQRDEDAMSVVGYTPARFYQVVNALLDRPDAEAEMPQVVHRLQRVRMMRAGARRGPVC